MHMHGDTHDHAHAHGALRVREAEEDDRAGIIATLSTPPERMV